MHRSSMKTTNMAGGISILKPPKPPCWRDFVDPAPTSHGRDQIKTPDYCDSGSKSHCVKPGVHEPGEGKDRGPTPHPHPQGWGRTAGKGVLKRVRAKIHRTRSQHVIDEDDLPDCALTMTLADTKPQEFGLGNRQVLDDRVYKEENARRCQSWLESIEACEPLDEIAYTKGSCEGEEVEVEIPEETRWNEDGEPLRPPFNTSASSSEEEEYDIYPTRESVSGLPVNSPLSHRSDKLCKSASSKSVQRLFRKNTLPHAVDTGLE